MRVRSIDVYVAYACDLRCKHCFLGDHLNHKNRFSGEQLRQLVDVAAREWGTEEITLLGGEPTLHPNVIEVVNHIQARGLRARLVTNGQKGFELFLRRFTGATKPTVYFSIDGSEPTTHDYVRGAGTFERLIANIDRARDAGYPSFGIMSVMRCNAHDVLPTLRLCGALGLQHVNVHYVTNRGYASEDSVLPLRDWQELVQVIEQAEPLSNFAVRVDHSLAKHAQYSGYCSVREENNLMFFPDGRVFICAMFFDVPGAHAFVWREGQLLANRSLSTERGICREGSRSMCPAMRHVNQNLIREAGELGCTIGCIYEKVDVRDGLTTIDSEMSPHELAM
jgi:MoaA/NifB/PqqE/SkfB family radical SAM enzyme